MLNQVKAEDVSAESLLAEGIIGKAEEIFNKYDVEIISIQKLENTQLKSYTYKIFSKCNNTNFKENILNELCKINGVREVYTSKKFYRQDSEGE